MEKKGAMDLYQEFITFLADSSKDFLGSYQSSEIHKIEEAYKGRFAERGIHVFYCRKMVAAFLLCLSSLRKPSAVQC